MKKIITLICCVLFSMLLLTGCASQEVSLEDAEKQQVEYNVNSTAKLRTDNDIYKKFTNKEKLLINTIYNTIYNAFPDEGMRESLIKKIERELTK